MIYQLVLVHNDITNSKYYQRNIKKLKPFNERNRLRKFMQSISLLNISLTFKSNNPKVKNDVLNNFKLF